MGFGGGGMLDMRCGPLIAQGRSGFPLRFGVWSLEVGGGLEGVLETVGWEMGGFSMLSCGEGLGGVGWGIG